MRRALALLALAGVIGWVATSEAGEKAAGKPAKIRALLITGDDVDVHPWREIAKATRDAIEASGKIDVKVSEDPWILESAAALKNYDVIVFLPYLREMPTISEEAQKNLLDFVKGGKGFYVQHLASASFPKWPAFGKLCGRYWVMGKSGHGPRSVFESTIAKPDHPITKGLASFKTDDELYAKLQGDGEIDVLVQADSDWSKKTEPLVFTAKCGKGRVVYNAYGHDGKALSTPTVGKLIARGVEWAATGNVE
jgi:type 1 glutamine amidotransferase